MLKVECESCKAPYQIDERRVPAAGLKMRCPKCGHSFVVKSPTAAAAPPAAAPAPAAPRIAPRAPEAAAARPPPPKGPPPPGRPSLPMALMVGDIDLPAAVADLPSPARPSADLPSPARPSADLPSPVRPGAGPVIQKRVGAGTMVGMSGPRVAKIEPPPAPPPPQQDDFDLGLPGTGGAGAEEADLPDLLGGYPAVAQPKRPPPPAIAKRPPVNQTLAFDQDEAQLPVVAGDDLPSPANIGLPAPAKIGLPASTTMGLPAARGGFPAAVKAPASPFGNTLGFGEIDLPVVSNDLPSVASALPSVASSLPSVASSLPSVASALPSVANALPSVANALPSVHGGGPMSGGPMSIPAALGGGSPMESLPPAFGAGDDFGELELPRAPLTEGSVAGTPSWGAPEPDVNTEGSQAEAPPGGSLFDENPFTSVPPQAVAGGGGGGFGEFDIPGSPPHEGAPHQATMQGFGAGATRAAPNHGTMQGQGFPSADEGSMGGMSFGELDLGGSSDMQMQGGGGEEFGEAALGSVIQPPPTAGPHDISRVSQLGNLPGGDEFPPPDAFGGPSEASLDGGAAPRQDRSQERPAGPSPLPKILIALGGLVVIGGLALMFTRYGAFGMYAIHDARHKVEYDNAATDALKKLHEGLKSDTYSDSVKVANDIAAQRAAKPRARALTAVATIAELETELRFGKEPERANRSKIWITSELPEPKTGVRYLDVASAAVLAIDRQGDKARSALDGAARKYPNDPIAQDIAFMRGELELRSGDGAAAAIAFTKALQLAPGGRAYFGLARAAFITGDMAAASKNLGETIKAAPNNGAALILRADLAWSQVHDEAAAAAALKDIATLLDGPARSSISTEQQAQAYAERGEIQFTRGRTAEARAAFEDSLKIDSRNVAALIGQGNVYQNESRYAEASGRFETAKQTDPSSVRAIVGAARMKIKLEKLADAKAELLDAVKKFPKSELAMQWLAESEATLGNRKDAEKDFLAAIELADPKDPDAIDAYAAYAEFLSREGRADDAQAKLKEAVKKLPDTAVLERALGDVADEQGQHDDAIAHFRSAQLKDPHDVTTLFDLGRALRRANRGDEASKMFDAVYEVDKSYPQLALERGLLLEQSGHIEEALAQFKAALDKHPNDPDLLLRVGAALVMVNKPDDALPKLKEVLRQRTNSAEAEHYIGRALMEQGGIYLQDAMRHLRTAVDRDQNRPEYHLYVGWLANDLGDPALAGKEISRALELDSNLPEAYWQKGVYEFKGGTNLDAERDLRRALQLKPTLYQAHAGLAQVYEQRNLPDQAIAEWRIAFAREDDNELWNFQFGKLLLQQGLSAEAGQHLKLATEAAEQHQPRPLWLTGAEFPAAEALRMSGDEDGAIKHYTAFLQHADSNDPYRRDALKALKAMGAPYHEE